MTTSIFADRINTYGNQTSAEALFFHSSIYKFVKGLRVLLPDKGLEFSDGSYIGTGAFLIDRENLTTHQFCVTLISLRSRRFFLLLQPRGSQAGKFILVGYHYKSKK